MAGEDRSPVTVIGLGLMGSALAGAFLSNGHPTTVWNRSAHKADALVAKGAVRAATVTDAVSASPLVVVCVRDYDAVREILDPARDALSGRVLVNLTSGSSQEGRDTALWTAERGAEYLDGAIMMTPPGIGLPETVILYGGPQAVFEAHESTLRVLGGGITYLDADTGIPSLYDVALLGIMWASLNGFLHALALVGTENVKAMTFLPFATAWLAGVGSFMPGYAQQVDEGKYSAEDATLETHLPPIKHLIYECAVRGIDVEMPEYSKALIEEAIAHGHATDSYARIIEHFRKPSA
jgi:3-hydroxyisobutyrate dehydrogenase-like beta-hydroxyacid dehydrogenase